jgi:hypothetical protein
VVESLRNRLEEAGASIAEAVNTLAWARAQLICPEPRLHHLLVGRITETTERLFLMQDKLWAEKMTLSSYLSTIASMQTGASKET